MTPDYSLDKVSDIVLAMEELLMGVGQDVSRVYFFIVLGMF